MEEKCGEKPGSGVSRAPADLSFWAALFGDGNMTKKELWFLYTWGGERFFFIHTPIYRHMHKGTCMHTYTPTDAPMHIRACTHTHTNVHNIYTYAQAHIHVHTLVHVVHVCIHEYMKLTGAYTYARICTHTHDSY